jgi:hypothetical protein
MIGANSPLPRPAPSSCTNEGNADLSMSLPKLIASIGIEAVAHRHRVFIRMHVAQCAPSRSHS